MAIDSTAELLFNISANADDATENTARFRALMGQDLDSMAAQFTDWSDEVLGDLSTVSGAMIAMTAGIAAGMVAMGAAVREATSDYQKYAEEIHEATVLTGLHAEDLSTLHHMAAEAGVDFGTLTKALGFYESNIVKAAQGSKEQLAAFAALGITQKDLIAGQKDELPLLLKTMDGFHNLKSEVQQTAIERELFGKGGARLAEVLRGGSVAFREAAQEAKKYGLTLSTENVEKAHQFTIAERHLKAEMEGIGTTVGKAVMPKLISLIALFEAGAPILGNFAEGGYKGLTKAALAAATFQSAYHKALADIDAESKKAETEGVVNTLSNGSSADPIGAIKEAKTEFEGLVSLVESMKEKIAEQGTGWDRLTQEVAHYHVEIDKATADLAKLQKAGTITPESLRASQAALAQIPTLLAKVVGETTLKLTAADQEAWIKTLAKAAEGENAETAIVQKAAEDRLDVTRQIQEKESTAGEQSYAQQRAQLQRQMADWAESLAKKAALTASDWDAIDKITAEGLAKIDRTETTGWQEQLRKLQEHLDQATAANATGAQKLALEYQKDLQQYSAVEEQKALKTVQTEAQIVQIQQLYGQIRTQITQKYQHDLQTLLNSQGFQGIFGSYFGSLLKSNQQLTQQWAQSTNQSVTLLSETYKILKLEAQQAFDTMLRGMGQTIVQAFTMGKSVSQAMEQMLASTLESFAGQAVEGAIMATAWGLYNLAMGNLGSAANFFASAAEFGTVGAVAAIAGKAITPASSSPGGSSGAAGGAVGAPGGGGSYGSGAGQQQPNVYVNISGPVIGPSGAAQLCDIINQAVYGNNAQLFASHNPSGVPL